MENFKTATRLGLRFNTPKGVLTTEQLWSLTLTELKQLLKEISKTLNKDVEKDGILSFLDENNTVDVKTQLTFDILKDVYITLKAEIEEARNMKSKKEYNEKIMAKIYAKEEDELNNLSVEELKNLLK